MNDIVLPVLHAELYDHFWSDQHDEVSAGNYNSIYYVIGIFKISFVEISEQYTPAFSSSKFKSSAVDVHMLIHVLKNCMITHLHDVHPLKKMS